MPTVPLPARPQRLLACRERDADVELIDAHGQPRHPGKRPTKLCLRCLGQHPAVLVIHSPPPSSTKPIATCFGPAAGLRTDA